MKSFNQFNEAYVIPIKNKNDIDNTPYKKKEELKDFFDYIVTNHKETLGDDNIPMVVDDMAKGFKIRNVKSNRTIVNKLKDEAKERGLIGLDFGQGSFSNDASGKPKRKTPAGACLLYTSPSPRD